MRIVVIGLLCLLGLALTACGNDPEPTPVPEPTVAPTPAETPTPAPPSASLINTGKQLSSIHGCLGCHSVDGRENIGPTWQGLFGKTETLDGIGPVVVDETYLTIAIKSPSEEIVSGFPDAMPSNDLQVDQIDAIIAYIATLK
ncbi:MAG: cytochrome c [SAR202 cluster bacterium]|nr:cytochrome c [SAR202 cluster bacterium]MDP6714599.1 cytochrome c [SAR202 cluster bacterium]